MNLCLLKHKFTYESKVLFFLCRTSDSPRKRSFIIIIPIKNFFCYHYFKLICLSKIILSNRTKEKADNLKNLFKNVEIIEWGKIPKFDIVINATSVGLKKEDEINLEINNLITKHVGPIAKVDSFLYVDGLPKTRSGKIMRRLLRKIASGITEDLGDTSTLLDPAVVERIITEVKNNN